MFRPLAAKRPIDVDHKQRRTLPETGPCAEPTRGEYGLVALGEKFVPDPLVRRNTSSVRHRTHPRAFRFVTAGITTGTGQPVGPMPFQLE